MTNERAKMTDHGCDDDRIDFVTRAPGQSRRRSLLPVFVRIALASLPVLSSCGGSDDGAAERASLSDPDRRLKDIQGLDSTDPKLLEYLEDRHILNPEELGALLDKISDLNTINDLFEKIDFGYIMGKDPHIVDRLNEKRLALMNSDQIQLAFFEPAQRYSDADLKVKMVQANKIDPAQILQALAREGWFVSFKNKRGDIDLNVLFESLNLEEIDSQYVQILLGINGLPVDFKRSLLEKGRKNDEEIRIYLQEADADSQVVLVSFLQKPKKEDFFGLSEKAVLALCKKADQKVIVAYMSDNEHNSENEKRNKKAALECVKGDRFLLAIVRKTEDIDLAEDAHLYIDVDRVADLANGAINKKYDEVERRERRADRKE